MMICTPGDFVTTFLLGAAFVLAIQAAAWLYRTIQHARKHAPKGERRG